MKPNVKVWYHGSKSFSPSKGLGPMYLTSSQALAEFHGDPHTFQISPMAKWADLSQMNVLFSVDSLGYLPSAVQRMERTGADVVWDSSEFRQHPQVYVLNPRVLEYQGPWSKFGSYKHTLPPLPYEYSALEPWMSRVTLHLHHDKHHQAYVEGLNKAEEAIRRMRISRDFALVEHWQRQLSFNMGGHVLHTIFWNCMRPGGGGLPTGDLATQIHKDFGSLQGPIRHMIAAGKNVPGSGWVILAWKQDPGVLQIGTVKNHDNGALWQSDVLLAIDVWEHSYYIDHGNDREGYLRQFFKHLVNWDYIGSRFRDVQRGTESGSLLYRMASALPKRATERPNTVTLPKGTYLFHGSCEKLSGPLRPGVDKLVWFAGNPVIAQLYICPQGATTYFEPEQLVSYGEWDSDARNPAVAEVRKVMGIHKKDGVWVVPTPAGWRPSTKYQQIEEQARQSQQWLKEYPKKHADLVRKGQSRELDALNAREDEIMKLLDQNPSNEDELFDELDQIEAQQDKLKPIRQARIEREKLELLKDQHEETVRTTRYAIDDLRMKDEKRKVKMLADQMGLRDARDRAYAVRMFHGKVVKKGEFAPGTLVVAKTKRDMLLWSKPKNPTTIDPQYWDIKGFGEAAGRGLDGVLIEDLAQSIKHGNLSHLSVGLFKDSIPDLQTKNIPATYREWEGGSSLKTPEWSGQTTDLARFRPSRMASPRRVVFRHLRGAITVPPRRGDRGRLIFMTRALRQVQAEAAEYQKIVTSLEQKANWSDLSYFFRTAGLRNAHNLLNPRAFRDYVKTVDWKVGDFLNAKRDDEYYSLYHYAGEALKEDPFSSSLGQDAFEEFARFVESGKLDRELEDQGMVWDPEYQEGFHPDVIRLLQRLAEWFRRVQAFHEQTTKRLDAERLAQKDELPKGTEKRETLYHASINAAQLYREGFQSSVPTEQSGLGGSQSAGGGKRGTSFTYDLYVAKEIARVLKELALIAHKKIDARQILDWAARAKTSEELLDYLSIRSFRGEVVRGRIVFTGPDGKPADPREVFSDAEKVAWLYKYYLMTVSDKRYDPYVMNPQNVIRKLRSVNPKSIGVVAVTVDMNNPDIAHMGGERELRVPPEAILSVDKFIR